MIVEYSYPCDIILPYIIHLILQQLHMRKKSPIGRSFAISKTFNKSESHCVLHAIFLNGVYPLKWCLSKDFVDNLYHLIWISWEDSTPFVRYKLFGNRFVQASTQNRPRTRSISLLAPPSTTLKQMRQFSQKIIKY